MQWGCIGFLCSPLGLWGGGCDPREGCGASGAGQRTGWRVIWVHMARHPAHPMGLGSPAPSEAVGSGFEIRGVQPRGAAGSVSCRGTGIGQGGGTGEQKSSIGAEGGPRGEANPPGTLPLALVPIIPISIPISSRAVPQPAPRGLRKAETHRDAPVPAQPAVGARPRPRGSPARSPPPPPQPPSSLTPSRYHAAGAAAAASSAASSPPAPRRRRGRRGRAAPGVGSGGGGGRRRTLAETGRSEEHRSRRRRWGRTCGSRWISERIPPTPHPGRFPSIPVERSVSRPGAKARGAEGIAPRNRLPSKEEQGGIATSFRSASLGLQPGSAQGLGRELGRELGRLARSALGLPTPRRRLFIIIPLSLLRPLLGT